MSLYTFILPAEGSLLVGGGPSTWLGGRGLQRSFPSPVQHKKEREKKKSTRGRIVRVFLSVASWRVQLHQLLLEIDFGFV